MEIQYIVLMTFISGLMSGGLLTECVARFRMYRRMNQFFDVNYNAQEVKKKKRTMTKLSSLFDDCVRLNKVEKAKRVLELRNFIENGVVL